MSKVLVVIVVIASRLADLLEIHVVNVLILIHKELVIIALDLDHAVHFAIVHHNFTALVNVNSVIRRPIILACLSSLLVLQHHLVLLK